MPQQTTSLLIGYVPPDGIWELDYPTSADIVKCVVSVVSLAKIASLTIAKEITNAIDCIKRGASKSG